MHGIELFYYYRQDVMSGMYNGRRFFRKDPGSAMGAVLKDAMCHARRLVEGYRESCVCVEEFSALTGEDGLRKKEYKAMILGKGGEIGFLFRIAVPLDLTDKIQARGSPPLKHEK